MINAERREELRSKLAAVSMRKRDKDIISARFGITDGIYRSLAETGKEFGVSGEAVRLIEEKFYQLIGEK